MTIDQTLRRDLLKTTAPAQSNSGGVDAPRGLDLDQHLVSSSKQVLLKKIDFQPAERDVSYQLQNLRVKYVPLNPGKPSSSSAEEAKMKSNAMSNPGMSGKMTDGIPAPKRVLCSPDMVSLSWHKCHRIGAGLINMGNTCFLNSVLQCLTYTPPLVNYLLSHHHKDECKEFGFCMMCALQTHIQRAYQHNQPAIRPMVILNKLKHIAKHMHQGRQEDAHEFLRYLVEAMQKSCVTGLDKLDRLSKETTIVYQIFGGYYRSRVTCSVCQGKSDTYDPFLDIGLDIKHAPSVHKAFERLIRPETLDGENMYQCKKCNRKVQAQKKFTIHRAPKILTLCLKRFDFNRFSMGKIHKDVAYTEYLNLRPYMSDQKGASVSYQLYGVLKHEGASCNSGHYYCYVKAPNQSWYCMNDAYISQVGLHRVLNQNAYLLFYVQREAKPSINGSMRQDTSKSTAIKQHPATSTKPANPYNGPIGTVVPRQPNFIGPVKPKLIADKPTKRIDITPAKHTNLPAAVPLPDQRNKLTFTLKRPGTVQNSSSKLVTPTVGNSPTAQTVPKLEQSVSSPGVKPKPPIVTSTPSKTKLQGLVKPKPQVHASSSKSDFKGLVPYSAEDSNSSSDSENYDALAAQMSSAPKDSDSSSSNNEMLKDKVVQNGSSKVKSDTERKEMISPSHSGMKPPSHTVSHGDISSAAKKRSLANGTDLTVLRKPDSPLKLTITTNGNAQRLKATGHWRVSDAESQVSPSPASDSSIHSNHSNMSTNSTSDWAVMEKKDAPSTPKKVKEEAAVYGWSITPGKLELMRSFSDPGEVNKPHNGTWDPERKPIKEAEDLEGSNVRTCDWLHNKHISHHTGNGYLFGFNVKEVKPLKDSNVPRNLNDAFHKQENKSDSRNVQKSKENNFSLFSHDVKANSEEMSEMEKELVHKKKKKQKKNKPEVESEQVETVKCEEKAVRTESEKAKSPDVGEGDSGYYSIKSKNNNSDMDEGDDGEDEGEHSRKPKKHKHKKKKKKRLQDDQESEKTYEGVDARESERSSDTQYSESQEYGPVLPESIKNQKANQGKYGPKLPDGIHKYKSHDHRHSSPNPRHKSEAEHRLKSPDHIHRHKNDSHRFRSPDHDGRSSHKSIQENDHKNRHRTDDRHRIRSPDYDRHIKSPSYDRNRVRSPDYDRKHKKYRSGDGENPKYRTYSSDRHRHSSDESDRFSSKFSVNRTSDDEDHSYAKRIKDKKRKRKHRDRDDYSQDEYSERDKDRDNHRDDYRRDRGDDFSRLGSPSSKKRKSLNGDSLDEGNGSRGYREERRKSDGKSRHDAPVQQWDHHIKDGYKRSSHDDSATNRLGSSWDGKRTPSTNVVEELNQSSMRAYGPAISSWEGGRSAIDEEVDRDVRSERTRDLYDQEFDRGKVKKVKHRHESDSNRHSSGYHNPFQAEQTRRNKGHFYQDHYDRHRSYPKKSHSWHSGR